MARPVRVRLTGLIAPVAVVLVWQLVESAGLLNYEYLPAPLEVLAAAAKLRVNAVFVHDDGDGRTTLYSDWMLLSRRDLPLKIGPSSVMKGSPPPDLWTDDYSNLLRVLR